MSTDPVTPVDFCALSGHGPLWGTATDDLNATVLSWPGGGSVADHVNDERDVLFVVLEGSGTLTLDGAGHTVTRGSGCVIPAGTRRAISAGADGIRYLTAHRVRGGLAIRPVARPGESRGDG